MDTLSGSVKGIITSAYFSTQRGYESQNKHVFLDADVNDHLPYLLDKYSRTKQTQLLITSLSSVHSIRCGLLAKPDRFVGLWWKTYTLPVDTVQIPIIDLLSRHVLHQTRTEMQTYMIPKVHQWQYKQVCCWVFDVFNKSTFTAHGDHTYSY